MNYISLHRTAKTLRVAANAIAIIVPAHFSSIKIDSSILLSVNFIATTIAIVFVVSCINCLILIEPHLVSNRAKSPQNVDQYLKAALKNTLLLVYTVINPISTGVLAQHVRLTLSLTAKAQ